LVTSNTTTPEHKPCIEKYFEIESESHIIVSGKKMKNELRVCTRRREVMDSLAHRFSSRRWPTMMQAQRSAKNTQSATTVVVLRYEVEESSDESNIAILSLYLLRLRLKNEFHFILIIMINRGIDE
jgi:hypothetical protein